MKNEINRQAAIVGEISTDKEYRLSHYEKLNNIWKNVIDPKVTQMVLSSHSDVGMWLEVIQATEEDATLSVEDKKRDIELCRNELNKTMAEIDDEEIKGFKNAYFHQVIYESYAKYEKSLVHDRGRGKPIDDARRVSDSTRIYACQVFNDYIAAVQIPYMSSLPPKNVFLKTDEFKSLLLNGIKDRIQLSNDLKGLPGSNSYTDFDQEVLQYISALYLSPFDFFIEPKQKDKIFEGGKQLKGSFLALIQDKLKNGITDEENAHDALTLLASYIYSPYYYTDRHELSELENNLINNIDTIVLAIEKSRGKELLHGVSSFHLLMQHIKDKNL